MAIVQKDLSTSLYDSPSHHIKRKISIIGLGYVGLMIASAFSRINRVIGFDINSKRIHSLKEGHDWNGELSYDELKNMNIHYTDQANDIKKSNFYIIAVPTPLDSTHHPDLSILLEASKMVGKYLKKGDIVVYESSVYPGATEEKCLPILEKISKLDCGKDFGIGYSPERINPADKVHTLKTIPKIISAKDQTTLDIMAAVYNQIVNVGTYKVSSIRIAEAIKIIENIQRDLNISLVNEIALILHALNMESSEVFDALQTKWNGLPFRPGLVGGHCLPVNSYYLTHKAEEVGYHPDVIFAGRRINEKMPKFIADLTIKKLILQEVPIKGSKIAIFGLSYKEETPDVHDTKVIDIINELKTYGAEVLVYDPIADKSSTKNLYGIDLTSWAELKRLDAVILAVAHKKFIHLNSNHFTSILKNKGVIIDLKSIIHPNQFKNSSITVWRL